MVYYIYGMQQKNATHAIALILLDIMAFCHATHPPPIRHPKKTTGQGHSPAIRTTTGKEQNEN